MWRNTATVVSLYCIRDATIAAAYAQLAAAAFGLASCWVGTFDERLVAGELNAPENLRPIALLPLGYGAETPTRPSRRPLGPIVRNQNLDGALMKE
jgi:nitroreductase